MGSNTRRGNEGVVTVFCYYYLLLPRKIVAPMYRRGAHPHLEGFDRCFCSLVNFATDVASKDQTWPCFCTLAPKGLARPWGKLCTGQPNRLALFNLPATM